jgi:hypothetical protein
MSIPHWPEVVVVVVGVVVDVCPLPTHYLARTQAVVLALAHLVFNQPKFLAIAAVGLRLSQVVRSTALGVPFPELTGYSAPWFRLRMSPRLLLSSKRQVRWLRYGG